MPSVLVATDANSHRITLNAPPLNILDIAMLEELRAALRNVTPDRHALIIDAAGSKAFSAGASVQDHRADRVAQMLDVFHDCFRVLAKLDLVTVALVRGDALGGGCELAMACDFVLAADSARFAQPEIQLGVFAPVASWQLSRLVPPRRGLELLLTGDPISAAEAERIGMVNAVFPASELDTRSAQWLERLYRLSASSLRIAKKAFRIAAADDFSAAIERTERLYLDELMKTGDAAEGLNAFLEKRGARWSGT